jgi:hypothetical protein
MHYKGEGVARDRAEAVTCFRRAAESGHAGTQYNLALLYLGGEGVQKDGGEAAHGFVRLPRGGLFVPRPGSFVFPGGGVDRDLNEVDLWLRKAADHVQRKSWND